MLNIFKIRENEVKLEQQNTLIEENNKRISELQKEKNNLVKENEILKKELQEMRNEKIQLDIQLMKREHFFIDVELKYIDTLSGLEFENYCGAILKKIGYTNVQVTQGSGDEGGDITATKDNIKYIFQCKRYSETVGNKAVQEVHTARDLYECQAAVVITNSTFTKQAKQEAEKLNIELWDINKLQEILYVVYHFDIRHIDLLKSKMDSKKEEVTEDDNTDARLNEAIELVLEYREASTSFIQRRMKIGYARAGRIVDQMAELGVISEYQGSKPREILMTKEKLKELNLL